MERTIPDLQAQLDQLSHALREWREAQGQLEPLEHRLTQLSERGAEILDHWADTDQRHLQAVSEVEARLNEWREIESRLHQDSLQRIRAFEGTIEQEWRALREMHEEPLKQLRDQAAALGETCMAAANLSLRGYERAEARLAALEADLRGQLSQLARDVHAALELVQRDAPRPAALAAPAAPFPLDTVMRIHDELRDTDATPGAESRELRAQSSGRELAVIESPAAASALSDRMASLEREITKGKEDARESAERTERLLRRDWRLAIGLLVGLLVVGGLAGLWFQRQVNARLDTASARAAAAETAAQAADRQIAAARAEADRQTAAAQQAALKASLVSDILSAPDLVRFAVVGVNEGQGAFGQVMWSRSRGLMLNATGLRTLPSASLYQAWLLTNQGAIRAGVFTPDAAGRATLVEANPPNLPRPVNSVAVTVEPVGGTSADPSGVTVLSRVPAPAPAAP